MAKETFQSIINNDTPTLVDFHATWCGPCKMMSPIVKKLKEEMGDRARILKVDIDKNPALADKLSIRSVPTFILYKGGEIKWQVSGGQTLEKLKVQIEKQL